MDSTRLSQGSPFKAKEQELPPRTGYPKTDLPLAEPPLLFSTWGSWVMLPLTEAQPHFLEAKVEPEALG